MKPVGQICLFTLSKSMYPKRDTPEQFPLKPAVDCCALIWIVMFILKIERLLFGTSLLRTIPEKHTNMMHRLGRGTLMFELIAGCQRRRRLLF